MSIRVMTAVWDHAAVSGGDMLVLLAMADFAHDDGAGVYPLQSTLAAKARMSERNLRYCLEALEEKGYIERIGKRGTRTLWRVEPNPANIATRQPASAQSGNGLPTEPLGEPSVEEGSIEPSSSEPLADVVKESLRPTSTNGNGTPPPSPAAPPSPGPGPGPFALCRRLAELMLANDPKAKVEPESKRWLDAARLLVDADGRHFEEALAVLEWSQQDEFWRTNVLSMPTFRKQYPRLRMRWRAERQGAAAVLAVSRENQPPASTAELLAEYERRHTRTGI
jgi:hypothetical protein